MQQQSKRASSVFTRSDKEKSKPYCLLPWKITCLKKFDALIDLCYDVLGLSKAS